MNMRLFLILVNFFIHGNYAQRKVYDLISDLMKFHQRKSILIHSKTNNWQFSNIDLFKNIEIER